MTKQTLSKQQIDEIETAIAAYQQHAPTGFACCSAHPAADTAAALLTEVRRLRAELRIGTLWKCHVCGKDNHRDVCLICETDRPDSETTEDESAATPA